MIGIKIDAHELIPIANGLANLSKGMNKYVAASINAGLDEGKPMAEGLITGRYNIGGVSLDEKKASPGNLKGKISGSGGMLPVDQFSPSEEGNIVSVEIKRGSRRPITAGSRGPGVSGAFMAGGRVMERRQASKYPIFPVSTIGIPQMLGSKAVSNPTRDKITEIASEKLGQLVIGAMKK